ncbi:hypothetical protein, partial [Yokenella regensburgei]|uniref:hypothetical protein n=1 Tax=Yokenella regensburgei TaxID=158877 RepID=UPI001B8026E8
SSLTLLEYLLCIKRTARKAHPENIKDNLNRNWLPGCISRLVANTLPGNDFICNDLMLTVSSHGQNLQKQ